MLKVIRFSGSIVADMEVFNSYTMRSAVSDAISDHGATEQYASYDIKKPSDIPVGWENAIPYGGERKDDKVCIDIFRDEILITIPVDDPDQSKFDFWKGIIPKI